MSFWTVPAPKTPKFQAPQYEGNTFGNNGGATVSALNSGVDAYNQGARDTTNAVNQGGYAHDTVNRWGTDGINVGPRVANQIAGNPSSSSGNPNGNGSGTPTSTGNLSWDGINKDVNNLAWGGGFDKFGKAVNSNFTVNLDPWVNTGPDSISDNYKQMIDEGKADGLSRWGQSAYGRSRADQGFALEDSRGQAMSDAAAGMNNIAMSGGLEGGAAENMLNQSGRNANKARTDIYRQGSMDRMGLDVADAGRKDTMRTQGLSGAMDVSRYNTDVQNINVNNRLNDLYKRNDFDLNKLMLRGNMMGSKATSEAMLAKAAAEQAKADNGFNTDVGDYVGAINNETGDSTLDWLNKDPRVSGRAVANNVTSTINRWGGGRW